MVRAQWVVFSDVILKEDSYLYQKSSDKAATLGKLPTGSIVKVLERKMGGFVLVEVELEEGNLTGWVKTDALEKPVNQPQPSKILIPKDEGLLIRREPVFLFGFHLGGSLGFIQTDVSTAYSGPGFVGGGIAGIFLAPRLPLRFEVSYSLVNGTADDNLDLSFGFLDFALIPAYQFDSFELFGGFQYSFGLGVKDIPRGVVLPSASDLSSVWGQLGAGYRIRLGYFTTVLIRLRYCTSFQRSPFVFNVISLVTAIEFQG